MEKRTAAASEETPEAPVLPLVQQQHANPCPQPKPCVFDKPTAVVLSLHSALQEQFDGNFHSENPKEFPSLGSVGHYKGDCKPCAFLHTRGCASGKECSFCHLCDVGEKKRRQKQKKQFFKMITRGGSM